MSRRRLSGPGWTESARSAALAACLAALTGWATPVLAAGGSWQGIGPSGGVVLSLAVDPAAPGTVYAAGGGGGLFKTLDGGRHWAHSDAGLLPNYIIQVAVDPAGSAAVLATTGHGVFRSVDGGTTWTGPAGGLGDAWVAPLAIDPRTPSTLYAGSGSQVWKSVGGGASWFASGAALPGPALVESLAIDPLRPARVYAGTLSGVFRSVDRGASWQRSSTGMGRPDVLALAADPLVRGTLYAGVQPNYISSARGLYVSTDGGATWTHRKFATGVDCLTVSPAAPRAVYACAAGLGLFKSADGGRSWAAMNSGLGILVFGALAIDPSFPARLYAGVNLDQNGGPAVYTSASGGAAWQPAGEGIATIGVTALAVDPARAGTLYGGTSNAGILASADDGGHWAPADVGLSGTMVAALAIDPLSPATLYAETEDGFFATADGGAHWTRPGAPFAGAPPLVVDPSTPTTLYSVARSGGFRVLWKSLDGGATWNLLGEGSGGFVLALAPSAPATLYETQSGYIAGHQVTVLSVSRDGGATFRGLPPVFRSVGVLAVDPTNPEILYLAAEGPTGCGLFKSVDGGQTVALLPGIARPSSLLVDPADPSVVYAGTTDVLVSRDGGATWTRLAPGLAGYLVVQLALGPGGTLYAGTADGSVYRLPS